MDPELKQALIDLAKAATKLVEVVIKKVEEDE
jgi:hypothetical protein